MGMSTAAEDLDIRRTSHLALILVCRKCGHKLKGGFGRKGKKDLSDALKQEFREAGQRRAVRVIETGCLSLCPKQAVTVMVGGKPGEMLAVPAKADVAELADRLVPELRA